MVSVQARSCLPSPYWRGSPGGAERGEPALSSSCEGLRMKTTLMRGISIALFIFTDASSGANARLTACTLHRIHYGGPLDGPLIYYTQTLLIIAFFFSLLLLCATLNAALKQNERTVIKRNREVVHLLAFFFHLRQM